MTPPVLIAASADGSSAGITPWPLIIVVGTIVVLSLLIVWAQHTTPAATEPEDEAMSGTTSPTDDAAGRDETST
ncbi:hypothetical protein [Pseudonocardia dioxanivorans]|uniref:hypothetical protein n=1 Tax=Pseudonocardia dioxanivorans TaxID=240495 RepID=UPI000CD0D8F8|nr:hypothetical protein [Pseudonocardia dioxanivorans]